MSVCVCVCVYMCVHVSVCMPCLCKCWYRHIFSLSYKVQSTFWCISYCVMCNAYNIMYVYTCMYIHVLGVKKKLLLLLIVNNFLLPLRMTFKLW